MHARGAERPSVSGAHARASRPLATHRAGWRRRRRVAGGWRRRQGAGASDWSGPSDDLYDVNVADDLEGEDDFVGFAGEFGDEEPTPADEEDSFAFRISSLVQVCIVRTNRWINAASHAIVENFGLDVPESTVRSCHRIASHRIASRHPSRHSHPLHSSI